MKAAMRMRVSEGGISESENGEEGKRAWIVDRSDTTAWTVFSVAGGDVTDEVTACDVHRFRVKTKKMPKGRKNLEAGYLPADIFSE